MSHSLLLDRTSEVFWIEMGADTGSCVGLDGRDTGDTGEGLLAQILKCRLHIVRRCIVEHGLHIFFVKVLIRRLGIGSDSVESGVGGQEESYLRRQVVDLLGARVLELRGGLTHTAARATMLYDSSLMPSLMPILLATGSARSRALGPNNMLLIVCEGICLASETVHRKRGVHTLASASFLYRTLTSSY